MNILIISYEFPPFVGGAGTVAYRLAETLTENDIKVTVLTEYSSKRTENYVSDINIIQVKSIKKLRPYSYWKELKNINLASFNKIVINDMQSALIASLFFPNNLLAKSVVYLHGSEPEKFFLKQSKLIKLLNVQKRYIRVLERCENIIAVSDYMKVKFLKYTKLNYLEEKIKVIKNSIDKSTFYYDPINIHVKYDISLDKKILISSGRIIKEKGYLDKYTIFKRLKSNGAKYHWIIVGEGPYLKELRDFAINDGIQSDITFTGAVNPAELRKIYSSSDVFWLLSNLEESFGLVYLEAIFCGTPAIGRNIAGVKETVVDGETGYLVKDNEECYEILYHEAFKEISKNNIKKYIESLKENDKEIIKVFNDLLLN